MRVAAVVVGCVLLAGCGATPVASSPATHGSATASPTAATTAATSTWSPPAPAGRDAYIRELQSEGIIPRDGDAQGAVDLAGTICQAYGAGKQHADVIGVLLKDGMSEADAGVMNAAAIVAFCPVFGPQI